MNGVRIRPPRSEVRENKTEAAEAATRQLGRSSLSWAAGQGMLLSLAK